MNRLMSIAATIFLAVAPLYGQPACPSPNLNASFESDGRVKLTVSNPGPCALAYDLWREESNGNSLIAYHAALDETPHVLYYDARCDVGELTFKAQTFDCNYLDEDNNCAIHPPGRTIPGPVTATVTAVPQAPSVNASMSFLQVLSDGSHKVRITVNAGYYGNGVDGVVSYVNGSTSPNALVRLSAANYIGDHYFAPGVHTIELVATVCNAAPKSTSPFQASTTLTYVVPDRAESTDCNACSTSSGLSSTLPPIGGGSGGASVCVGQPVNVGSGDVSATVPLFSIDEPGQPLSFDLSYHSSKPTFGTFVRNPIAPGWTHPFNTTLNAIDTAARALLFISPEGDRYYFVRTMPGVWVAQKPSASRDVVTVVDGRYRITTVDGSYAEYDVTTGHWIRYVDRWGNATTGTYDSADHLTGITDAMGRFISLAYTQGRLTSITLPNQALWRLEYDGSTIKVFDPLHTGTVPWRVIRHDTVVDSRARMTRIEDDAGMVLEEHQYDASGRGSTSWTHNGRDLIEITYGDNSATVTHTVDATTELTSTYGLKYHEGIFLVEELEGGCSSCGGGSSSNASYAHDDRGRVLSRTDASGLTVSYSYDLNGNVTSTTESGGTMQRTRSSLYEEPTWATLPTWSAESSATGTGAKVTTNSWNAVTRTLTTTTSGRLLATDAAPVTYTTTAVYDSRHRLISTDGPRTDVSDVTTYAYYADNHANVNLRGRLHTTTSATGLISTFSDYDLYGTARTVTDPNGVITTLQTDARGRVTHTTNEHVNGDSSESSDYTTTRMFDSRDRMIETTSAGGFRTSYVYEDGTNRLLDTILVDAQNRQVERRHLTLNTAGLVIQEEDQLCASPATTCTSWVTKRSAHSVYDAHRRLTEARQPASATAKTVYTYDSDGRVETVKDENHSTPNTTYEYDDFGRLSAVVQSLSTASGGTITTSYLYDVHDNLKSVTDPNGNVTSYLYDDFGRMQKQTSPVTGVTTYSYDPAGNLTSTTDANGATTTRTYDAGNRPLTATSVRTGAATESVTWTYDETAGGPYAAGHLTTMADPSGSTAYQYDRRGLLKQESRTMSGTTFVQTYGYDADGNRTSIGYPSGRLVAYTYDFAGRPLTATGTRASQTTQYVTAATYLPFGPVTSLTLGNGTVETRTYDTRYLPLTSSLATSSVALAQYTYATDGVGNITGITDNLNSGYNRTFGYDDLNRLTTANSGTLLWGTGSYTYDRMGNLTAETLGTRARSISYQGTTPKINSATTLTGTMAYDPAGNELKSPAGSPNAGGDPAVYSSRNLLAAQFVRKYDRCDLEPGMNCLQPDLADVWRQNAYDGRGVRVQTTEVEILDPMSLDGSAEPAPPVVFNYFYTPELTMLNIVGRTTTTISGTAVATSTRSADVIWFGNRPIADHDETTVRYTFTDHLGTPILQTSATATVVWRAEYEPYGNIHTLRTGVSSTDQPLRFPGQQAEYVTPAGEERYNIFRWYRAGWGRYTQADPFADVVVDEPYGYASGNSLRFIDPFGLTSAEKHIDDMNCCELLQRINEELKQLQDRTQRERNVRRKVRRGELRRSTATNWSEWVKHRREYNVRRNNLRRAAKRWEDLNCFGGLPNEVDEWAERPYGPPDYIFEEYRSTITDRDHILRFIRTVVVPFLASRVAGPSGALRPALP